MSRKFLLAATAAISALGIVGPALADPQSVEVVGSAEKFCKLPDSYQVASAFNATASQFAGNTWTIPESAITTADGQADGPPEVAIRLSGWGSCNTSHLITVTSLRGGLVNGNESGPAPAGFSHRRPMLYEAHWSQLTSLNGGPGTALGPTASITASAPSASNQRAYTVSGSLPPPGVRRFDVRMGVVPVSGVRMVAGDYSDIVTVSLTVN